MSPHVAVSVPPVQQAEQLSWERQQHLQLQREREVREREMIRERELREAEQTLGLCQWTQPGG